ncbi:aspartyl-phosphate phosphatase Spo0E family protein [Filibacter tadaridae]|uniref:Spo0E like sporulation regulatory protein n=1 Tax=Filibacter tadaridae TaxID=2483811 RepID=A0A3P5WVE3_9BACL|nr:aspartyl-phosphate phosphatase Spo0E family protein [Filibacter tadaridae]VDC18886.1 Spo0E like sporulation regulatory protein [Filibacter tadaridae]
MIKTISRRHILSKQIQRKRLDMYTQAKRFGLTHPIVVARSQELDYLLNKFQGIKTA